MYLRVRSPHADIHISAPKSMSIHRIKIFLTEKKHWIDAQKQKILLSNTEKPKCIQALCTEGAIHSLWGETHTLHIQYTQTKPYVQVYDDEKKMLLYVSTDTPVKKYADTMAVFYKSVMREKIEPLLEKWQRRLGVKMEKYSLQSMKTLWGSCHPYKKHLRFNTQLAYYAPHLLEYVVAHEMAHLIHANHGKDFKALLDAHYPIWREAHQELKSKKTL